MFAVSKPKDAFYKQQGKEMSIPESDYAEARQDLDNFHGHSRIGGNHERFADAAFIFSKWRMTHTELSRVTGYADWRRRTISMAEIPRGIRLGLMYGSGPLSLHRIQAGVDIVIPNDDDVVVVDSLSLLAGANEGAERMYREGGILEVHERHRRRAENDGLTDSQMKSLRRDMKRLRRGPGANSKALTVHEVRQKWGGRELEELQALASGHYAARVKKQTAAARIAERRIAKAKRAAALQYNPHPRRALELD